MPQKKFWFTLSGILAVLAVALVLSAQAAAAGKYKILHRFTGGLDGADPIASLISDADGNLYGTTFGGGGSANNGIVFKMTPNLNGSWAFGVLHLFHGDPALHPFGGLVRDKAGNLYGTTADCASGTGCQGVVYEATP